MFSFESPTPRARSVTTLFARDAQRDSENLSLIVEAPDVRVANDPAPAEFECDEPHKWRAQYNVEFPEEIPAILEIAGLDEGNEVRVLVVLLSKDYRNMVLLSDAIDVIAVNSDFKALAGEVVEKLYTAFRPDRSSDASRG